MKKFIVKEAPSEDGYKPSGKGKTITGFITEKEADEILNQLWADNRVWWKEEVNEEVM